MGKKKSSIREPNAEEIAAQKRAMDEKELRKLARQARLIKSVAVVGSSTEKQTIVKNILAKEKGDLIDSLALMRSRNRCITDYNQSANVTDLFTQGDALDAEIALEKKYINDLEAQIRAESHQYQLLKKEKLGRTVSVSDYNHKEENKREERTLESWKSKLHAVQLQLGIEIQKNTELRNKIKILLKEKTKFNTRFEELMQSLRRGKMIMADIVQQAKTQFQRRDELVRKIGALKQRDQADLKIKSEEVQELEMKVEEDKKLASYKYKVQIVRHKMHGESLMSGRSAEIERTKIMNRFEKLNEYFQELKKYTELETPDEICEMIVKEDKNLFSLFNFNNEIRDELEVLIQKTAELVRRVDEEENSAELEKISHNELLNKLRDRLGRLQYKSNALYEYYESNQRVFDRLLAKVKVLFDIMHCDPTPMTELLGNNKDVTRYNYRLFLCLVETKIMEMLDMCNSPFLDDGKSTARQSLTTVKSRIFKSKTATVLTNYTREPETQTIVSQTKQLVPDKKIVTAPCADCSPRRRTVQFM